MPLPGLIIGQKQGKVEFVQTKRSFWHLSQGQLAFRTGILREYCLHLMSESGYWPVGTRAFTFSRVLQILIPSMDKEP
jgi:hypothetical protein